MAERQGIYISQLPESTSLTDNMLFATDNGADNNSISAANLAQYVNNKIDVAGQVNNGVSEANSYADTKKTEAVSETKGWAQGAFSNPNLLINGDFQVWQRGTEISQKSNTNKYTADRWICGFVNDGKTHTFKKHANGIMSVEPNGGYVHIRQVVQIPDSIRGKKVCLSVCVKGNRTDGTKANFQLGYGTYSNGTWSSATITPKSVSNDAWETFSIVYSLPESGLPYVDIYCFTSNPIYIKWVKLELGEVATPFVPLPYAEELLLCQRYYQKLNSGGSAYYSLGSDVGRGDTTLHVQKNLSIAMRTIPTVTVNGSWRATTGSSHVAVNSIFSDASTNIDILSLNCTSASSISNGSPFVLQASKDTTAKVVLDAEIY